MTAKILISYMGGNLGCSHMQGTLKALGHEADNLSAESARKEQLC